DRASCSSVIALTPPECSNFISRGTSIAQTFKYAAGDSRRTRLNTSRPCCCQSSARSSRCAAPCQSQSRATSPPSRYPHLSQAAFAPFRSVALSIFGRPSFTPCATARSALIRQLAPAQLGQMQDRRKSSKCDALHALGPCSQGSHCAPMRISRRSRNNKNDTHVAINGATSESGKRHEPVAQVRRSGDCLRLHHSNHRIDVCGFEPELLFAVDLSLCKLRQVFGKALFE